MLNATDKTIIEFLSTPSGWRATSKPAGQPSKSPISIHALRVEGDAEMPAAEPFRHCISIHALRVEGDELAVKRDHRTFAISIHALRVEGDSIRLHGPRHRKAFLSTPSGWRATYRFGCRSMAAIIFLSTPSGWRATTFCKNTVADRRSISIHALRVEGDSVLQ
mgnify:CR=1 FL=1